MDDSNLDLIRARYEAVNAHDFERFQGFYAPEVRWLDPALARPVEGPEAVRQRLEAWISAVPDLEWRLEDLFGEGDRICALFTFTGTQAGPVERRGETLSPTKRRFSVDAAGVYTVRGGQIVESRIWFDLSEFGHRA
jgi:predicted ester cyclase